MQTDYMVRDRPPVRRDAQPKDAYHKYRAELREDFNNSCGYCGDSDERCDKSIFHIDHFAPKSLFPELGLAYTNLVYSCRYCNVSKSNHWIGVDASVSNNGAAGFIDPCSTEYEINLGRSSSGRIYAKTIVGSYILKRLKLGLLRHELLWQSRRIRQLRGQVDDLIQALEARGEGDHSRYIELLRRYLELSRKIDEYERGAYA
jgi:uncharacterized protein (TIGR02646 family)